MQVCHIKPHRLKFKFSIDAEKELSRLLTEELQKWGTTTSHRYRYRPINNSYFRTIDFNKN